MATFNCGSSVKVPGGFIEQTRKKTELIGSINGHLKFHQQSLTLSLIYKQQSFTFSLIYKQLIQPEVNSGDGVDEHFLI